jgi:acyl-CoA thioester hydrolase
MNTYPTLLESKMKIRFHDCDPFNHLNNSRYIDYMMTARTDQLEAFYGIDFFKLARETGISWVVAETHISYLAPAFLAEEVVIQTRLISFTDKSLHVEALMWNNAKTKLKSVFWTTLVHINLKDQRTHKHSQEFMELFNKVVHPLEDTFGFESRVAMLKNEMIANAV